METNTRGAKKYDLSKIMRDAWAYRRAGATMSEALKQAWSECKKSMMVFDADEYAAQMQCKGAKRWVKNGKDRLYINSIFVQNALDLTPVWGKRGRIECYQNEAGDTYSCRHVGRLVSSVYGMYVDLCTREVVVPDGADADTVTAIKRFANITWG